MRKNLSKDRKEEARRYRVVFCIIVLVDKLCAVKGCPEEENLCPFESVRKAEASQCLCAKNKLFPIMSGSEKCDIINQCGVCYPRL